MSDDWGTVLFFLWHTNTVYLPPSIDTDGSSSEAEDEQQPQQQQGKSKSAPTVQTTESTASQQVKKSLAGGKKWEGEDEDADDTPVVRPKFQIKLYPI